MKANEAPEKIYVEIKHPFSEEYTEMIAFEDGDGIEYIRTDAFIDKVCEFIETDGCLYIDYDEKGVTLNTTKMIDDIKQLMKGE